MESTSIRGSANRQDLITHRLDATVQRLDAVDERLLEMNEQLHKLGSKFDEHSIVLAKLDTKMNIVLGILGTAGVGASVLLVRLLGG